MAGGGELSRHLERSRSRGDTSRSQSWRIAETTLSSFDSMMGERVLSRATTTGEWALLTEASSFTNGAASDGALTASDTKKKVMVVVDASRESRLAMLWALSHMVRSSDTLTLIHVLPASSHKFAGVPCSRPNSGALSGLHAPQERCEGKGWREKADEPAGGPAASELVKCLQTLCASRRPEVQIEVMIVEGVDKGMTIVSQAKKLEATILVLGQKKPSLLQRLFNQRSPNDQLVDYCIQNAECLTLAVRKKNKHMGGYLINSRWQRNFWLLA